MDIVVEFNYAAFKHGYSKADIFAALDNARYDGPVIDEPESENKYLVVGFDTRANPIEVMYNVIDERTINVFHALSCSSKYIPLLKGENVLWHK